MENIIYNELKKMNLISKSNLILFNKKTRDKAIKVWKDLKTKIIFLDRYITNKKYYQFKKSKLDKRKTKIKSQRKHFIIKFQKKTIKTTIIDDEERRIAQFQKYFKNKKDILDFGCGWGGFLKKIKNFKSLNGIELREDCLRFIKKNIKKINVSNDISFFEKKFDIITMFHVLEHIPNQLETLKILKSKLKYRGKIIIEVPHAEDLLLTTDGFVEFKNFTLWSEHLILHTPTSLKAFLKKVGFTKINIQYFQRYNLANHLGWFVDKKPNGHMRYNNQISDAQNLLYRKSLEKLGKTDTLIAIAE